MIYCDQNIQIKLSEKILNEVGDGYNVYAMGFQLILCRMKQKS